MLNTFCWVATLVIHFLWWYGSDFWLDVFHSVFLLYSDHLWIIIKSAGNHTALWLNFEYLFFKYYLYTFLSYVYSSSNVIYSKKSILISVTIDNMCISCYTVVSWKAQSKSAFWVTSEPIYPLLGVRLALKSPPMMISPY